MNIQSLAINQPHVWQINLTPSAQQPPLPEEVLSDAEWIKVNRLRQPLHRQRAILMRIQLRLLLAQYLHTAAADIQFSYDQFGKPQLKDRALFFNVSHSADRALVAISLSDGLGVDIEYWRPVEQMEAIVNRHYSTAEKVYWRALSLEQREAVFFNIWTCKEAFIKATGRGLGMGLSRCGFKLDERYQLESCPAEYGAASQWSCQLIPLGDRVSAAIILQRQNCQPLIYRFDPQFPPQIP